MDAVSKESISDFYKYCRATSYSYLKKKISICYWFFKLFLSFSQFFGLFFHPCKMQDFIRLINTWKARVLTVHNSSFMSGSMLECPIFPFSNFIRGIVIGILPSFVLKELLFAASMLLLPFRMSFTCSSLSWGGSSPFATCSCLAPDRYCSCWSWLILALCPPLASRSTCRCCLSSLAIQILSCISSGIEVASSQLSDMSSMLHLTCCGCSTLLVTSSFCWSASVPEGFVVVVTLPPELRWAWYAWCLIVSSWVIARVSYRCPSTYLAGWFMWCVISPSCVRLSYLMWPRFLTLFFCVVGYPTLRGYPTLCYAVSYLELSRLSNLLCYRLSNLCVLGYPTLFV